jgi:hypothetical protein
MRLAKPLVAGYAPSAPTHPTLAYEPSHVIQLLAQALRDIGLIGVKYDRLISDVSGMNKEVRQLQMIYAWLKGSATAAVVLIPLCAIIVWWLIGDKLNDIKTQVLQARPAHSQHGL